MRKEEVVTSAKRCSEILIEHPHMLIFKYGVHNRDDVQAKLQNYADGPVMFRGYDDENRVDAVHHRGMDWYHVIEDSTPKSLL